MIELADQDLLSCLDSFEDNFVERKTSGDSKDWLKTAVAFANSAPVGHPAVLFIGVRDDGTMEETVNLDSLQKTLNTRLADAYPPIYYATKIVERAGRRCLAVIIPGSPERPHFAGQSYVRVGSETRKASEEQFSNLVTSRNSKAYEILKWKDKLVSVLVRTPTAPGSSMQTRLSMRHIFAISERTVVDCNQFYVTLKWGDDVTSCPLQCITISFDHRANRLKLEIQSD